MLIAFEGGEGSGKSTQIAALAESLRADGIAVTRTFEPGATPIGRRIRTILLDDRTDAPDERADALDERADARDERADARDERTDARDERADALDERAEALLFAADRAHHVATVIRPALARGEVVLTDRFIDSSLAYQGVGRSLSVDEVRQLSRWATGGVQADLTIVLDIPVVDGLARAKGRGAADRMEQESIGFHERVRAAFLDFAVLDPARYRVFDALLPVGVLAAQVRSVVDEFLRAGGTSTLTDQPGKLSDPAGTMTA